MKACQKYVCFALFVWVFCGPQGAAWSQVRWLHGEDGAPLWVGQGKDLHKVFRQGISPVLKSSVAFVRLGVRWDAAGQLGLQARFSRNGSQWTPWSHLIHSWREGIVRNSHADPPFHATYVQLKVVGEGMPTFLAAELIPRLGPMALKASGSGIRVIPPGPGATSSQGRALTGPFNPRSAWGAKAAKCTTKNPTKNRIAIHHTVTPNNDTVTVATRLRGIQSFHQGTRGWCDIGYHLLVSQDGQAWEGTPAELLGTHVGGNNTGTLGISFLGTFDTVTPNNKMLCAAAKLVDWGVKTFGVKRNRTVIMGHRQFPGNSTSCPGNKLFAQLDNIVKLSSSSGTCKVPPPPKCDYVKTANLNGGTLNIRGGSNTTFPIVGTVKEGVCLKVEGKADGQSVNGDKTWYKITHSGVTGWISGYYTQCSECGPKDTKAPVVTLTSPKDGHKSPVASIRVKGTVKDDVGVVNLEVHGKKVTPNAKGEFEVRLTLKPGSQKITANAWDAANNKGSASIQVSYEEAKGEPGPSEPSSEPSQGREPGPEPRPRAEPTARAEPRAEPPSQRDAGPHPDSAPRRDGLLILEGKAVACAKKEDCPTSYDCVEGVCRATAKPPGGCGCHDGGSSMPAVWGLLLLLLWLWPRSPFSISDRV